MRIIRGRFGRRKLLSNPGDTTRPITDKVKESLFEYLEDELQGARVADIFSGTGTIGLETRAAYFVAADWRKQKRCDPQLTQ